MTKSNGQGRDKIRGPWESWNWGQAKDTFLSSLVVLVWAEVAVAPLGGMVVLSLGGMVLSLMGRMPLGIAEHLNQAGVWKQTCV